MTSGYPRDAFNKATGIVKDLQAKKIESQENIAKGIGSFFRGIIMAAALLLIEAEVAYLCWNDVFDFHPLTFTKCLYALILIRIISRSFFLKSKN